MSLSNPFGSTSSSSNISSSEMKSAILQQIQAEAAMTNARTLMEKINSNCFEKCIPSPGSSLSSNEQTCIKTCMEKYISLWNTTSQAYSARLREENEKNGMGGGSL
ncbi:mitochondrial import inner membrane translocase subunit tim13 [Nannizzia gypsea CBS 118893]|uniref:Mitochondrial import inner membrane translocase subunit n=1 Tax=Arthroderma gypseum (strain ATCC MYA-4604 / CBS 118893) TaxID=535722 RepID=E4UML2_ARTGP|nr:mitochondrial import inner membrane translocase subunit tim13 [Nannizzia gypsea CBS 118893]EFQ99429.1 mitochondrial import inner membrane translocase subunit tim13 [Nannizzia gypsea CBS 118893]